MNKYQEAFEIVDRLAQDAPNGREYLNKHHKALKELVEKATPKKPDNVWEHLGLTNYTCPTCSSGLTSPADGFTKVCKRELYCYRCGQALDWSKE